MVDPLKSFKLRIEYYASQWNGLIRGSAKSKKELAKIPDNKEQAALFPNEIILKFLEHYAADVSPQCLDKKVLRPLLQMASVSKDCYSMVDACLQRIYTRELGSTYKPEGISWTQALSLLYNWQQQMQEKTYWTTAQEMQESLLPVDCHLIVKEPALIDDQVEIGKVRLSLVKNSLVGGINEETSNGKVKFKVLWRHHVSNHDKHLFISVDKTLVATQHLLIENKEGNKRPVCRFDVRSVQSGHIIGSIIIFPEKGKKQFELTDIEFDLKQFAYRKEGKLWTRYYQESVPNNCLMLKA